MKALLLFTLVSILAFANGCATAPCARCSARPPLVTDTPDAKFLIISAVYGSGAHFADVTDRVNALLAEPGIEFFARPEWLRADPTPGWNKALVITFEYKGRRRIFTTGEGGTVSFAKMLKQPEMKTIKD
jgi:hypothetical protein